MVSRIPILRDYEISGSDTVDLGYDTYIVTLNSGITVNLTLPDLTGTGDGETIRFKRGDTGTGTLNIVATGGLISGSPNVIIQSLEELNLVSIGLNWYIISDPVGDTGIGNFLSAKHLFVDSILGDDATARINDPAFPWKTITSAVTVTAGLADEYLIYVRAGFYMEINLLLNNPVYKQRFYFEDGAVVQGNGILFSGSSINAEITGYGEFRSLISDQVINVMGNGTLYFEALKVINNSSVFAIQSFDINSRFKIDTVTGIGGGLYLTNSNIDINIIETSAAGIQLANSQGSIKLIKSNFGVLIEENVNLQIQQVDATAFGIQINNGINNLDIGTITGTNGITITGNTTLTGSVGKLSTYLNRSDGTVIDTLKIGIINNGITLNGFGNYISNWDINSVSGGLNVSGTGNKNITATIQKLTGGYTNIDSGTLTENLTFGTVDFINFSRPTGCTSSWIINSLNSTGSGINLNNSSGIGIFNIRANSITAAQNGIFISNSQTYVIDLEIGAIIANDGIYNGSSNSVTLNGKIDSINANFGFRDLAFGPLNQILTIGTITAQDTGIYHLRNVDTTCNLIIDSITAPNYGIQCNNLGGTGIYNLQTNSINVTGVGIDFRGNQNYLTNFETNSLSASIGLNLVTGATSQFKITANQITSSNIGINIENTAFFDINFDINSINVVNIGLVVTPNSTGILNLNGEIRKIINAQVGYANVGQGRLTENLNFGSIQGENGIIFNRISSDIIISNWIINKIDTTTSNGIYINNSGTTGIFNIQANSVSASEFAITFTNTQNYDVTMNINSISGDQGIQLNNSGNSRFNITANIITTNSSGLQIESSQPTNIDLNIGKIIGTYGIQVSPLDNVILGGSIKKIIAADTGYLNPNSSLVTNNLNFGSIEAGNFGISITSIETTNISIDRIVITNNNSGNRGIFVDSGATSSFRFNSIEVPNLVTAIETSLGNNTFIGRHIRSTTNGINSNSVGVLVSGGVFKGSIDYVSNFFYGVRFTGGGTGANNAHQFVTKLADTQNYTVLCSGYQGNFILGGAYVTRGVLAAIGLNGTPVTSGNATAAIQFLPGLVAQATNAIGTDYSVSTTTGTPGNPMVFTLLGQCYFYPYTQNFDYAGLVCQNLSNNHSLDISLL